MDPEGRARSLFRRSYTWRKMLERMQEVLEVQFESPAQRRVAGHGDLFQVVPPDRSNQSLRFRS